MCKQMNIESIEVFDDSGLPVGIEVKYLYDGVWCKGRFSLPGYMLFCIHVKPSFNPVKLMRTYDFDKELLIDYINHIITRPEHHAYLIDLERNTEFTDLLENTHVILSE